MSNQDSQTATLGLAPTLPSAAAAAVRGPIPLDDIPLNAFHVKIAGLTFGAHFTEGFALGTIGYALASLNRQMPLDAFWMGMIGSSALDGHLCRQPGVRLAVGSPGTAEDLSVELSDHHRGGVRAVLCEFAVRVVSRCGC